MKYAKMNNSIFVESMGTKQNSFLNLKFQTNINSSIEDENFISYKFTSQNLYMDYDTMAISLNGKYLTDTIDTAHYFLMKIEDQLQEYSQITHEYK